MELGRCRGFWGIPRGYQICSRILRYSWVLIRRVRRLLPIPYPMVTLLPDETAANFFEESLEFLVVDRA